MEIFKTRKFMILWEKDCLLGFSSILFIASIILLFKGF